MAIKFNLENLSDLTEGFQLIYEYGYFNEASQIYDGLDKLLTKDKERQEPDLYRKFNHLKAKYGFACLASLTEKEILELLKSHLAVMLEIKDYDLWENLKRYLVVFSDYKERDRVKKDIRNILIKNQARITKTNLLMDNKNAAGTVENWLRDYHVNLGLEPVDQLKFEEYFIGSPNIKRAAAAEKEKIKSLFKFYERLKLSSNSPKGFEEKVLMEINGKLQVWNDGRLEDFDPAEVKAVEDLKARGFFKENEAEKVENEQLLELKTLAPNYPPGSLERKAVEEEIKKMELGI